MIPRHGPSSLVGPGATSARPITLAGMKVLVTGGAGFIGSNFVHLTLATRPDAPGHRARRAHLRRVDRDRWTGSPIGSTFVEGDVADAGVVDPLVRRRRRRRPLRRRVAQRQLARRPQPVRAAPTSSAPSRCWRRPGATTCATTTSPPTRSTATSSSTTRRDSPRTPPTTRARPYSSTKAGLRPAGAGVGALVRSAGDDLELLEQLRPVAARREVHPAPDHERARRHPAQALRRRAQRARLDPRRRPQRGRAGRSSTRASSARPTSSAPTARSTTATSCR